MPSDPRWFMAREVPMSWDKSCKLHSVLSDRSLAWRKVDSCLQMAIFWSGTAMMHDQRNLTWCLTLRKSSANHTWTNPRWSKGLVISLPMPLRSNRILHPINKMENCRHMTAQFSCILCLCIGATPCFVKHFGLSTVYGQIEMPGKLLAWVQAFLRYDLPQLSSPSSVNPWRWSVCVINYT